MSDSPNVVCQTLGCKINQCETEKLKSILEKRILINNLDKRHIVLVNTCCVTNRSESESRQKVRHAINKFPDSIVVATGCAVQKNPSSFSKISGIDYVLGNQEKMSIGNFCIQKQSVPVEMVSGIDEQTNLKIDLAHISTERTRAFVKIQDGCNAACSYCIVPKVRGRSRSVHPKDVLSTISSLLSRSFKEIVLTGIHLGCYGLELSPKTTFDILLKKITNLPGNFRIRLSSVEPDEITEDLLELLKNPKICNHLHIPLQSGDDNILKRMNRNYTTSSFAKILEKIERLGKNISVGTDVIVGFPGETETEFLNTYNFLNSHSFSYFHVFRYSRREGTISAKMPNHIHGSIRKERSSILRKLGEEKKDEFKKKLLGSTTQTLILEKNNQDGIFSGLTENYLHLPVLGKEIKINTIIPTYIKAIGETIVGATLS